MFPNQLFLPHSNLSNTIIVSKCNFQLVNFPLQPLPSNLPHLPLPQTLHLKNTLQVTKPSLLKLRRFELFISSFFILFNFRNQSFLRFLFFFKKIFLRRILRLILFIFIHHIHGLLHELRIRLRKIHHLVELIGGHIFVHILCSLHVFRTKHYKLINRIF